MSALDQGGAISGRRYQTPAIVVASAVLSTWLIGAQVLHADWGMIDDHETLNYIGAGNHHLSPSQYFHVLFTQTELGAIGKYLRFRPFYYPALLGEAVAWGDNIHLWYACRVALLALFIAAIWTAIARYLGIVAGLAVVLIVLRAPFWGDVWARLGPGEIYGTVGLGLWILGIERMFASPDNRMRSHGMLAVTIGTIMMVGSKETLFPFSGYTICAFAIFALLHSDSLAAKIHLAAISGYSAISAFIIGIALSQAGKDFAGQSVGLSERIEQLVAPLSGSVLKFLLPGLVLLSLSAGVARWFTPGQRTLRALWLKPAAIYAAGVMLLWSLYLSQYIAYSGQWPTGMRYDFPGVIAFPALIVISLIYAAVVSRPYPWLKAAIKGCTAVVAVIAIGISVTRLPFPVSKAVAANIDRTSKFQEQLREIAARAKKDPQTPIIFRANGIWSYEKIASVAVYLHGYHDVTNPIAVKFHPEKNPDPKFLGLGQIIKQWEQEGGRQQFVPLASVAERAKVACLSVGFDGPAEPGCSGEFEL